MLDRAESLSSSSPEYSKYPPAELRPALRASRVAESRPGKPDNGFVCRMRWLPLRGRCESCSGADIHHSVMVRVGAGHGSRLQLGGEARRTATIAISSCLTRGGPPQAAVSRGGTICAGRIAEGAAGTVRASDCPAALPSTPRVLLDSLLSCHMCQADGFRWVGCRRGLPRARSWWLRLPVLAACCRCRTRSTRSCSGCRQPSCSRRTRRSRPTPASRTGSPASKAES